MASATVSIAVLKPSSHGLLDTDIIIKTAVLRLNVIFRWTKDYKVLLQVMDLKTPFIFTECDTLVKY